jgi:hypothetical protein
MLAHGRLNREDELCVALVDNNVKSISLFAMLTELSEALSYRVATDVAYFAYLAVAYAKRLA